VKKTKQNSQTQKTVRRSNRCRKLKTVKVSGAGSTQSQPLVIDDQVHPADMPVKRSRKLPQIGSSSQNVINVSVLYRLIHYE
jgi:hypothetical protein